MGSSELYEFHTAIGQFINYKKAIQRTEPDRVLYLAVPKETYQTFFKHDLIEELVLENNLKIIVYNPEKEVIEKWIS